MIQVPRRARSGEGGGRGSSAAVRVASALDASATRTGAVGGTAWATGGASPGAAACVSAAGSVGAATVRSQHERARVGPGA